MDLSLGNILKDFDKINKRLTTYIAENRKAISSAEKKIDSLKEQNRTKADYVKRAVNVQTQIDKLTSTNKDG